MLLTDLHVHSTFCDGHDTPRQIVLCAIEKGVKNLGILAHSCWPYGEEYCLQKENEPLFISEVSKLKQEFKDKIKIYCGIEKDFYTDSTGAGFDYAIGSVHLLEICGEYYPIDFNEQLFTETCNKAFNGNYIELAKCYYKTLSKVIEKTNANIIGHFDLVTKFNKGNKYFDETNAEYVKAWQTCADELIKYDRYFEINTGGMARAGKLEPYPSNAIIKYLKQKGAKFILSSDAHKKEHLLYNFCDYASLI